MIYQKKKKSLAMMKILFPQQLYILLFTSGGGEDKANLISHVLEIILFLFYLRCVT